MFPYYALTGLVVVLSYVSEAVRKHFTRERVQAALMRGEAASDRHVWTPVDLLVMAAMIGFSALRYQVGTDYGMYILSFESINTSDWREQIDASPQELGYIVLSLALRTMSDSPFTIFWAMATLTVVPIYITLKKKSSNIVLALALYIMLSFFVSPFNVMRQGAAVALNFWASTFLDRNRKCFVLLNLLASLFHTSVLLVAALQWLVRHWRPTKIQIAVLLVASVVAAFGLRQASVLAAWLAVLNPRYETYIGAEAAGLGTYLVIALYFGLLAFARTIAPLDDNSRYVTFVLLGTACLIVGTQSIVLSRMEMYLSIFLVLLLPNQIEKQKVKTLSVLVVCSIAAVFFAFYLSNWADLVPYTSYIGIVR